MWRKRPLVARVQIEWNALVLALRSQATSGASINLNTPQYSVLLRHFPKHLFCLDSDQKVATWNADLQNKSGLDRDQMINHSAELRVRCMCVWVATCTRLAWFLTKRNQNGEDMHKVCFGQNLTRLGALGFESVGWLFGERDQKDWQKWALWKHFQALKWATIGQSRAAWMRIRFARSREHEWHTTCHKVNTTASCELPKTTKKWDFKCRSNAPKVLLLKGHLVSYWALS
jgi:hypothetical protein